MKAVLWGVLLLVGISIFAGPVICVDKKRIDFGKYPANVEKHYTFKLTNTGDSLLKITKVRKTCGCSRTDLKANELLPGKSTELTVYIKSESVAGPFNKTVFVQNNDPKTKYLMLSLNGNSVPLVNVKPKNKIYAGTLKPDKEWKQEFILELSQKAAEFDKPQIDGHPASITLDKVSDMKYKLTLSITAKASDKERFFTKLKLPIKSPTNWKPVEITVMGKVTKVKK